MTIPNSTQMKVQQIFQELVGERARRLKPDTTVHQEILPVIEKCLADDYPPEIANEIAFHLVDWNSDAAFLLAVMLFPERFEKEEISEGITDFLIHVPNHICGAATRAGYDCKDIFAEE